jgi:preprotein translocase subunit SecG
VGDGADTPYNDACRPAIATFRDWNFALTSALNAGSRLGGVGVSLGGDLSDRFDHRRWSRADHLSGFAKRLSMILFALFFLGFLVLLVFAYLVAGAISHAELVPALVAVSV